MQTMFHTRKSDQFVDEALRAVDPARRTPIGADVQRQLDDLGERIAGCPQSAAMPTEHRRRPRRSPRAAIAAVAALGVLGGGAALAAQYTTHTGIFGQPGKTENDTSEYIDPNAPDFVAYARQLTADIQFAPGDSADHYWWYFEVKNADGRASLTQVTGIKGTIANAASCSWQRAWLAAYEAHDVAGMKQASNEIHQAARSSALAAVNQAAYTEHLVDAADRGDPTALRTSLRMACPAPKAEATR